MDMSKSKILSPYKLQKPHITGLGVLNLVPIPPLTNKGSEDRTNGKGRRASDQGHAALYESVRNSVSTPVGMALAGLRE